VLGILVALRIALVRLYAEMGSKSECFEVLWNSC